MLALASAASVAVVRTAAAASTTEAVSDVLLAMPEFDALSMCHSITVASFDPVTKVLPSGESPKHVIGAPCPDAVSKACAFSVDITFKELSACPPAKWKNENHFNELIPNKLQSAKVSTISTEG